MKALLEEDSKNVPLRRKPTVRRFEGCAEIETSREQGSTSDFNLHVTIPPRNVTEQVGAETQLCPVQTCQ